MASEIYGDYFVKSITSKIPDMSKNILFAFFYYFSIAIIYLLKWSFRNLKLPWFFQAISAKFSSPTYYKIDKKKCHKLTF